MITRQEFLRRLDAAKREENRVAWIWLAFFFPALFVHVPIVKWLVSFDSQLIAAACIIEMAVFLFGNVCLMGWYLKHRPRRFGLECPTCGTALTGFAGQRVAQWGNCPKCRTEIWIGADPDEY